MANGKNFWERRDKNLKGRVSLPSIIEKRNFMAKCHGEESVCANTKGEAKNKNSEYIVAFKYIHYIFLAD